MALNASAGTRVSPAAFPFLSFFHCTSEFFPGDGVIEFPHNTSLWDMFNNCRICGAVIVEGIVEMRSEDFHVLGGIGRLFPLGSRISMFVILL